MDLMFEFLLMVKQDLVKHLQFMVHLIIQV